MHLSLGYSPCPNDTFIFYAIAQQKIDTEGLDFQLFIEDVEALNQRAFAAELDITKLSFYAYAQLQKPYILLPSGAALGQRCGPLVVKQQEKSLPASLANCRIAIPGEHTTANFLFSLRYPEARNKQVLLFSEIEDAVASGAVDAGVIIHESRFTFQEKGLAQLEDLGEFWEFSTQFPIPLGGIVARRRFDKETLQRINRVLRRSIDYAHAHRTEALQYVRQYAQSMQESVMLQHIKLYVNEFTNSLDNRGEEAVRFMFNRAQQLGLIDSVSSQLFVEA